MRPFIQFFVQNNKFTAILSLILIVWGLQSMFRMRAESYPSVNFAMAIITTNFPGASPEEVETKVTKPIEDEIRSVSGLKDVKSTSQSGLSTIVVRVDMDNEDEKAVLNEVQRAVDRVQNLPAEIQERPKFLELKSEEFPAIDIAVIANNEGRARDLFVANLQEDLEDVPGVLGVRKTGFREREFSVRVKTQKLQDYHLSIQDILSAIKARNQNIPSGKIKTSKEQWLVRLNGIAQNADELKNIVVRSNYSGNEVKLSQVADVVDSEEEAKVLVRVNGQPATLLVVTKKAGADTIKLVDGVKSKIEKAKSRLPIGGEILITNNEGEKVVKRMNVLIGNATSGLVLVLIFLMIFLPGRVGVMASLSLPFSVLMTFGAMSSWGMNFDTITILALVIALGMLVDNAVVIAENFVRHLKDGKNLEEATIESARQFWLPITITVFTTVGAFLPMLMTKGIMGQFIKYIPIVVSLSLIACLIECFFLLPMRLKWISSLGDWWRGVADKNQKDWFDGVSTKFEKLMKVIIEKRYISAFIITALILGSFVMVFKVNKFMLFPPEQTEIYIARFEMPQGSTIESSDLAAGVLEEQIQTSLGDQIKAVVSRAGSSGEGATDEKGKNGDNYGMVHIYVTRETSLNVRYTEILEKLRKINLPQFKKLTFEARVNGPPVGAPLDVTLRSHQNESLEKSSKELLAKLSETPGILNVTLNRTIGEGEIRVLLDEEKVARLGLSLGLVGNTIKTALEGVEAVKVTLDNRKFNIKLKISDEDRQGLEDLYKIVIPNTRGDLIPLREVARLVQAEGTPVIKRFDYQRSLNITADVDEKMGMTPVKANQLAMTYFNEIQVGNPSVSLVFGGEGESTKESMKSLFDAMIIALMAIFALMVFMFNSYLRPAIIMSTIPLGMIGFAVAFFFHQRPVSFMALIGVIGLAGIIVNAGIILISFIDDMRAEGKLSLEEILAKASGLRLRPVLATSLTTVSGLFPTAYGIGGNDAMLIPMTLAMAWGLTTGTILTLVWVPPAYAILEDMTQAFQRLTTTVSIPFFKKKKAEAVSGG